MLLPLLQQTRKCIQNHGSYSLRCRMLEKTTTQARTRKRPRSALLQQTRSLHSTVDPLPPPLTATTSTSLPSSFRDIPELRSDLKEVVVDKIGIESMTEIQSRTWQPGLDGNDIVGRSETGSGKTLAYLLPSLQRILEKQEAGIRLLILAPTRELVQQIHSTVATLTRRHSSVTSQPMFGGVPRRRDVQVWEEKGLPTILTATPGRLEHHLRMTFVHSQRFRDLLQQSVEIVVLDEMDRLLDMGFRQAILSILAALPQKRQTLLFSATAPASVHQIIQQATNDNNRVMIDCLHEQNTPTVATVDQSYVILPVDKLVAGVVRTVLHLMKAPQHKIIVFFPTTSQVAYFTDVFNTGLGRRVWELRSPLHPTVRSTNADAFRYAQKGALFATDVCARGMDYPGVTTVVQVGAASNRETYIHRLGRTARAGKVGAGILLLMEGESDVLQKDLSDMDISVNSSLQRLIDTEVGNALIDEDLLLLQQSMLQGKSPRLEQHAAAAYVGLFAFYTQQFHILGMQSSAVVRLVNAFAEQAGLSTLPPVPSRLVKQFRLDGHPRLNVQRAWRDRTFDVTGRPQEQQRSRRRR